jgi:glutamate dehydrogenase/leucine dehydrogenase
LLKDQIKDWQITIAMVRDCLDHVGMLGNLDCAEEHKNCAQSLEAMIHEMDRFIKVLLCNDTDTGLRAVMAIHSTALGPATGGVRMWTYDSEDDAVIDALRLARGMTYKYAAAGLDHGGGKAVIIGDPHTDKTEALLRAYGRFVQSLHGRYLTACDVGTTSEDMDIIARECGYVTGRTTAHGGAGDSSVLTAYGVFQGMRAAATATWGSDSLAGRVVGVAGVGKVGRHLVRHLVEDGAQGVLQQPSADSDAVVIAIPQGLVSQPLGGGEPTKQTTSAGRPAAPDPKGSASPGLRRRTGARTTGAGRPSSAAGVATTILPTPATRAGTTLMMSEDGYAAEPPGT